MQTRNGTPIWLFSLMLFPLCAGGSILGLREISKGYESLLWTSVPGVILSAGQSKSVLSPPQPEIRYQYITDGKPYVSTTLWPGTIFTFMPVSKTSTQNILQQFSIGKKITVYVNPQNPMEMALIPGPYKALYWMGIFGFFCLIGLFAPKLIRLIKD